MPVKKPPERAMTIRTPRPPRATTPTLLCAWAPACLAGALTLAPGTALADEKAICLDAVAKGQTFRDEHKLIEAREQFRVCARSQCPGVVQGDCVGFLDAVEKNLPSVVFAAKDGTGADLTDVSVSADGQAVVARLDGAALPMNPGTHTFVFTRGAVTAKTSATILEGAKNQVVSATLRAAIAPATVVPPAGSARSLAEPAPAPARVDANASEGSKGATWLPIAAMAVGGVGLATGVVFSVLAHGKRTDGDNLCTGGVCPDAVAGQVGSLNSDATTFGQVAVASYVVGGVALAAGVVLQIVKGPHAAKSGGTGLHVAPTVGPGTAGIAGVF
jgi:hypothetical protein